MNYSYSERLAAIEQYGKDLLTSPACQRKIESILQKYESSIKNLIQISERCKENALPLEFHLFGSLSNRFFFFVKKNQPGLAMKIPGTNTVLYYSEAEGFSKRAISGTSYYEIKLDCVADLEIFERDFPIAESCFYLYLDEFLVNYEKTREREDANDYLLSTIKKHLKHKIPEDALYLDSSDGYLSLYCLKADGISVELEKDIVKENDIDFDSIYPDLELLHIQYNFLFPPQQSIQH